MTYQKTLKRKIEFEGIGLFSGIKSKLVLHPAKENSGVNFKRVDLNAPILKAHIDFVKETNRRTMLGLDKNSILTVEHLLSAIAGFGIDNILVEIDGPEVPIIDGSSKFFAKKLFETGFDLQKEKVKLFKLESPVYFSEGDTHLIAIPSNEYKISFTLHHQTNPMLQIGRASCRERV